MSDYVDDATLSQLYDSMMQTTNPELQLYEGLSDVTLSQVCDLYDVNIEETRATFDLDFDFDVSPDTGHRSF